MVAKYPTTLPAGQAAPPARVAPPAPSLQTGTTPEPVRPEPLGLNTARSPAVSPLKLESAPESTVTGCPDCARYVPLHSHPLATPLRKPLPLWMVGRS